MGIQAYFLVSHQLECRQGTGKVVTSPSKNTQAYVLEAIYITALFLVFVRTSNVAQHRNVAEHQC